MLDGRNASMILDGRNVYAQVQISGMFPGNTANILNTTTLCNSIVHVVDQVLLPTASLATVPAPGNGLNKTAPTAVASAASTAAALFPGLALGGKAANASGVCQQAFLDAANQHNLTFLVQVLQYFKYSRVCLHPCLQHLALLWSFIQPRMIFKEALKSACVLGSRQSRRAA